MIFIAILLVRPEAIDRVRDLLIDIARQTASEEGALSYQALQSASEPAHFQVVERYRDRAAFEAHMASSYVQDALREFEQLLEEPPATSFFEPFAEFTAPSLSATLQPSVH
ncbi:putative quinol monooxygenase [Inquilinus sp. OTU3971]|uniref:putative quinol monooxygenase n=1 Tax=Inquilinus sp. OTU3971 TaxID=3043855 RepID=UPI00313F25B1